MAELPQRHLPNLSHSAVSGTSHTGQEFSDDSH